MRSRGRKKLDIIVSSRKDRKKNPPSRSSQPSFPKASISAPAANPATTPADQVRALEIQVSDAGLPAAPAALVPSEDLDELKRRAAGVIESFLSARTALDERDLIVLAAEKKVGEMQLAVGVARAELAADQAAHHGHEQEAARRAGALADEAKRLDTVRAELDALRAGLVDRDEKLKQREVDADAGFLRRREAVFAELDSVHQELLSKNMELAKDLERARHEHARGLLAREAEHRTTLDRTGVEAQESISARERQLEATYKTREEQLRLREQGLRERETVAAKITQTATWDQKDAQSLREHVQQHIEERAQAQRAEVEARLNAELTRTADLRDRCAKLEQQLEERRAAERALSHESPEQTRARLDRQALRISELEADLVNRPSASEAAELRDLREEGSRLRNELRSLQKDLAQVRRQLETRNIQVDENEILNDRNTALKENQRLLRAALDDLRGDIDERLNKHGEKPVFPELLHMDEDHGLQQKPGLFYAPTDEQLDLRRLTSYLQHRIGRAPNEQQPDLYYRAEDIRSLLGGLAMSRLHLLQGISGIGKSSLPRRFAQAVGGRCETISVQAGWRDRNDLLGYYNAFEHRYYESPFVQALYKAQTPQYEDRIFLVLLDEMNLSHPEQYAADVLDVLARDVSADRRFELMSSSQPGRVPARVTDGRYLCLPDNVWFVGTANHDETTKDFADKTYDRSFVLTLPGAPLQFPLRAETERPPLAFGDLTAAFGAAMQVYKSKADEALTWMDNHLRAPMVERFGIGWGGRLEDQVHRFVPVVLAAGGSLGEAMDQLITTRILRRIQGRHDLLEEDVRVISTVLETSWIDGKALPADGLRLLRKELKRLGANQ
jgi:hypothetical protein